jgi:hypothetical protein
LSWSQSFFTSYFFWFLEQEEKIRLLNHSTQMSGRSVVVFLVEEGFSLRGNYRLFRALQNDNRGGSYLSPGDCENIFRRRLTPMVQ